MLLTLRCDRVSLLLQFVFGTLLSITHIRAQHSLAEKRIRPSGTGSPTPPYARNGHVGRPQQWSRRTAARQGPDTGQPAGGYWRFVRVRTGGLRWRRRVRSEPDPRRSRPYRPSVRRHGDVDVTGYRVYVSQVYRYRVSG